MVTSIFLGELTITVHEKLCDESRPNLAESPHHMSEVISCLAQVCGCAFDKYVFIHTELFEMKV